MGTQDELGGVNATLRASCTTTTQLVLNLSDCKKDKAIRQLLNGTLILLWDDHRPKVRKAAQEGASEVVLNRLQGSFFTDFSLTQIDSGTTITILHTFQWLKNTILYLNVEKLGQ